MTYKDTAIRVNFTNDKVPAFVEPKASQKLKFVKYGEANNYPNFLLTLFNRSAKHNAILVSKQAYIKGQGFTFDQTDMEGDDIAKLQAFIEHPNPYESLTDLMSKTCLDEEIFGGFYVHGISTKSGGIASIYHMDYSRVRTNEDNTTFYISDFWLTPEGEENTNLKPEQYKELPLYDPNKKQKEWLFYYKSYRPGIKTYTLPGYIGAVPAIITDAEIANFHRAEIQNGFKGSKMIIFKNGVPSDEEMKAVERQMKLKFAPTDQAGVFVIDFVDDPQRVPEILDLSAGDFDKKYDALNKTIQEEIFVGHRVTSPMLFGVRVEGQLGGRNEMVDAFNLFQNTYISPKQQIQEMVFDYFAPVKGKLYIQPTEPIMPSFSEAILEDLLTQTEMRGIIGRKELAQGDLTVSQQKIVTERGLPPQPTQTLKACNSDADDTLDFSVFQKYGEPIENFVSVKQKKFVSSRQDFALSKLEQGVLDLVKKTPDITVDELMKVMKVDKTKITDALETLIADKLIEKTDENINATSKGEKKDIPTFEELFIRYRYVLRPDAPKLVKGGESRDFCKAMIDNPRYFSREDIDNISLELGQLYGIPDYDAFVRKGGWFHDVEKNVNLPYCRHSWNQELVKRA